MSTSKKIREDENFIYLYRYLHDDPDEYSEWTRDKEGKPLYSQHILDAEDYAAYELRLEYRINKKTGDLIYDRIDG